MYIEFIVTSLYNQFLYSIYIKGYIGSILLSLKK